MHFIKSGKVFSLFKSCFYLLPITHISLGSWMQWWSSIPSLGPDSNKFLMKDRQTKAMQRFLRLDHASHSWRTSGRRGIKKEWELRLEVTMPILSHPGRLWNRVGTWAMIHLTTGWRDQDRRDTQALSSRHSLRVAFMILPPWWLCLCIYSNACLFP